MSSESQFTRRPYTGSCHCGLVKYIVYLTLPTLPYPKMTQTEFRKTLGHRLYKCNCTLCHKTALLHFRPLDAANDLFVITPKDPLSKGSGLQQYVPAGCTSSWQFCATCGVRTFSLRGTGYNTEAELPTALLQRVESRALDGTAGQITAKEGETTRVAVWRPSKDWQEHDDDTGTGDNYMSINAFSLDNHNENWDMAQLQEKGYVSYMETLRFPGMDFEDKPCFGGAY